MSNSRIPFSLFDFFAYLFPGLIFIIAILGLFVNEQICQKIFDFLNLTKDFIYVVAFIILIIIYGLGHIVSGIGSFVFEDIVVGKFLGYPQDNLLKDARKKSFFPKYTKNYSKEFRYELNKKYKEFFGEFEEHYDYFILCFNYIKEESPTTLERLVTYNSFYEFSRNSAMAFIILTVVSFFKEYYFYGSIFLILSYIFFLRYLKFFRIFVDEVFRTFYVISKKN